MERLYPKNFVDHLSTNKILIVGVGGIGCELLKNLSMIKFKEIHIVPNPISFLIIIARP